jgi:2-polyprenyl-6-methoxyphenol hydroxylase-like FAD-dependent oxidoreductase
MKHSTTDVLIVGAGPTGLTLACELARRQIPHRLIEAAAAPFNGSRAKGLQPRTLEVLDDLGIVDTVLAEGCPYPRFRLHVWGLSIGGRSLDRRREPLPDVPYPNLWMLPQWRTEQLLRERLRELGGDIEYGHPLTGFSQDGAAVIARVGREGQKAIRAAFMVGCDGGHSVVRKGLGVRLEGETLEDRRIVVADVDADSLGRSEWHVWPLAKGCMLTLCPLPGTSNFQLTAPLRRRARAPDLTVDGIRDFVAAGTRGHVQIRRAGWMSLYQPQVRMVDRYRIGRVLLAGDAAHVHPPAGGQGLNTGVQDAYNLGWKLAHVLAGAPDALLESYQTERLPVAAAVLGLSKRLLLSGRRRCGVDTNQLGLHYRGGPLADESGRSDGAVHAGDRAPDAPCEDCAGRPTRLFDVFRGPHFTLLAFGNAHCGSVKDTNASWAPTVRAVRVVPAGSSADAECLVDSSGHAHAAFGVRGDALVLVRPDGHIGLFAAPGTLEQVDQYLRRVIGAPAHDTRDQTQHA